MQHADSAMTEWYDQSEDFRSAVDRCRQAMAHTWYPILISNTKSLFVFCCVQIQCGILILIVIQYNFGQCYR